MVLCYKSQLSNVGKENYKLTKRFQVNKTEGSIADHFCQICVYKGICSADDGDLRGVIIFFDKSTKAVDVYSSISEE
ncbi:unnamed protein product [Meloidogyne enterolobii]|uniref:Uncharacterized protein n=1 Tax=Meloidogyne enterolobii TaxID=390850 RepID=A0ACB0XX92_MELEN